MEIEEITAELQRITVALGFEFVGTELVTEGGEKVFRLYADRPGGISLDECEKLAGEASAFLDEREGEIDGAYLLEVSSPGLERPLFTLADYARFTGKKVNVRLKSAFNGRKRLQAQIEKTADGRVFFRLDNGCVEIPFERIMLAKLVYEEEKGRKKTFKKTGGKK